MLEKSKMKATIAGCTPLKTNMSSERSWLEDDSFPFHMAPVQVTFVHFRVCRLGDETHIVHFVFFFLI